METVRIPRRKEAPHQRKRSQTGEGTLGRKGPLDVKGVPPWTEALEEGLRGKDRISDLKRSVESSMFDFRESQRHNLNSKTSNLLDL